MVAITHTPFDQVDNIDMCIPDRLEDMRQKGIYLEGIT